MSAMICKINRARLAFWGWFARRTGIIFPLRQVIDQISKTVLRDLKKQWETERKEAAAKKEAADVR